MNDWTGFTKEWNDATIGQLGECPEGWEDPIEDEEGDEE